VLEAGLGEWEEYVVISKQQAIDIARLYVSRHYDGFVEDAPEASRLRADLRPDNRTDADVWEVLFPWKPVEGLIRSSPGCGVLIDADTGDILE